MSILCTIPAELTRKWTESAKKCYFNGCNCANCCIVKECESITPSNCRMKSVVLELVKKFGKPKSENNQC